MLVDEYIKSNLKESVLDLKEEWPENYTPKKKTYAANYPPTANGLTRWVSDQNCTGPGTEKFVKLVRAFALAHGLSKSEVGDMWNGKHGSGKPRVTSNIDGETRDVLIERKLREGGPRRTINQEVKDSFVHAVCLIPDPEDRMKECKEVFDKIHDDNVKEYMKSHPEASQPTAEAQIGVDELEAGIKLKENMFENDESWWDKQKRRIKAEPTIQGKIGKAISNILFGGDDWDDLNETMKDYLHSEGLSSSEKMKRINEVSSVFRKFDGRGDVYSKEEIEEAALNEALDPEVSIRENVIRLMESGIEENDAYEMAISLREKTMSEYSDDEWDNLSEAEQDKIRKESKKSKGDNSNTGPGHNRIKESTARWAIMAFHTNGERYILEGFSTKDEAEDALVKYKSSRDRNTNFEVVTMEDAESMCEDEGIDDLYELFESRDESRSRLRESEEDQIFATLKRRYRLKVAQIKAVRDLCKMKAADLMEAPEFVRKFDSIVPDPAVRDDALLEAKALALYYREHQ